MGHLHTAVLLTTTHYRRCRYEGHSTKVTPCTQPPAAMGSSSEDDGSLVVKEENMMDDGMDEDMDPWDDHPRRSAFSPYRVCLGGW